MKRMTGCVLAAALFLSGCAGSETVSQKEQSYEEFITVDVFDSLANYQGIQSGWFAKLVKDKFNMELNIIAPNVAGGGDTLFEMRAASGKLGDLVLCDGGTGTLADLAHEGLLLDMSDYIEDKQIMRFEKAIRQLNDPIGEGSIYAIPSEVSENAADEPSEVLEPTYGPYLRWDLYKQLGYPEMETLEDLLPVLLQMQALEPVTETGEKTWAISFFRDWDGNLMNAAKQPCCFYGYDEYGFVLVKADGSEYQNILDENSIYMRVLKWYFEANQLGLVDPESATQNYENYIEKYEKGQILYSPWPWVCQVYYNTASRMQQGKGFMMADIGDMEIYSYGCSPQGSYKVVLAVGSQAKDSQRLVDFIDWLYSPEGISAIGVSSMHGTAGPKGLTWDYGKNGPYLTEFGEKALFEEDVRVPDEWGGGTWNGGISQLNFLPVSRNDVDDRGYPYIYQKWDSVIDRDKTPLEEDWSSVMGADSTMEYLMAHEKLSVAPGCGYTAPTESAEESEIRRLCKSAIQEYSWAMVFAEDEEEFISLMKKLRSEVSSLGYEKILALDMENARLKQAVREQNVKDYSK